MLARLRYHVTIERVIIGVILAFLAWEIVVPIAALLFSSVKDVRPDDPTFFDPSFTFSNIREVASGRLWEVTARTAIFAVGSSLLAVIFGGLLAFITTRTNAVMKGLIAALVLYQLAMPEVLYPVVWTFLLGPELGFINQTWSDLTGFSGPLMNIFSMPGMILTQAFLLLPLVYLFMVPAVSAMDRSLEEAAEVSGATTRRVMWDIVFKLALPAVIATAVIALMRGWEAFEVPWFLGLRDGNLTYSTELYFRTVTPPSDTGLISAFALPMIVVALVMVWYYNRFNKAARKYATMSGKSYRSEIIRLKGVTRWLVSGSALAVLFVGVLLPFMMLLWISVQPFYRRPSLDAIQFANFDAYTRALSEAQIVTGFKNSLIVGVGSSLLILLVVSLSGWFVVHGRHKGRGLLDMLTFVPMSFPNIVVGICLLWLYLMAPFDIRGTYLILLLAYFILFVAIAARNVNARMMQMNRELHEAATVSGASFLASFRTVTIPLLGPALLASGLYITSWAFKELETTLLLSDSSTKTATVVMFDQTGLATTSQVAAIGVVSIAGIAVVIALFQITARRFSMRGF